MEKIMFTWECAMVDDNRVSGLVEGLPEFPLDDEGFPLPGLVIKHFRERMKYKDSHENKEKGWTQTDLAKRLGVSEVTVRLMENQNVGLDSITRRRLVASILKIPPILLGLGSLDDLAAFLQNNQVNSSSVHTSFLSKSLKRTSLENETLSLYKDAASVYKEMHSIGTAQDSIFEIEQWIGRIHDDILRANGQQKLHLQASLWNFYDLTSKIQSDDLGDWTKALQSVNAQMELATVLDDNELRAATLYRSGQIRFAQRKYVLAKSDLDNAVALIQKSHTQLKGAVLASAGLAHALVDKDTAGKLYAQRLFEDAGRVATDRNTEDDGRFTTFNIGKYHLEYADALIALGRPAKALEMLDFAENEINPNLRRRRAYVNILRAEASISLKKPELYMATTLLTDAFDTSKTVKSDFNVGYISRLYQDLSNSSYGNSIDVADLGLALRQWKQDRSTKRN